MVKGLGRGLDSLIPKKTIDLDNSNIHSQVDLRNNFNNGEKIFFLDPEEIKLNPYQPRKIFDESQLAELANSIKEHGIIQPLIVSRNKENSFELIAGERRLRASKLIKLEKIPVILRKADSKEKFELALIENIQRQDLNPIETALAYKKLIQEFKLSQNEVANRVGKSRASVANSLRFLFLPEIIKKALSEKKITEGHAKYLAGLDNEMKQLEIFRKIVHNNLSVSDTGNLVKKIGGTKQAKNNFNSKDNYRKEILRDFFKTKVNLKRKGKSTIIDVCFYSDEELDDFLNKIKK